MNSLEIKDKRNQLKKRAMSIIETCKMEVRDLTEDEAKEVEQIKSEIADLDIQLQELKDRLEKLTFEDEDVQEMEEKEMSETKEESENNKKEQQRQMNKKSFSLLRTIRSIVNNQPLDAIDLAVINAGQKEARKSGLNIEGQIQLPSVENRTISVASDGEDVVATDVFDIMQPLRAKNVLVQAGAKVYSNLVGNVKIPVMSGANVQWETENGAAADGGAAFSHVELNPKRLTCYVDISKTLLAQDSVGVEEALRNDIIAAVNTKLEQTILGDEAGSTTKPEGILHAVTPEAPTASFADILNVEASVEDANVLGECKYIMSNKAKAKMRAMSKGTKSTQLVYENGAVDGTQAFNTSNCVDKTYIYGDFSNIVIGNWASTDVIVDPYTQAGNNAVRLVVNAYFDAAVARPAAFGTGYFE